MADETMTQLIGPKVAYPTPWTAYFNPDVRVWELIDQNGVVVDPRGSQEMAQLIVRVINDAAYGRTPADLREELEDVRAEREEMARRVDNSLSPKQANEQVNAARMEGYKMGRAAMQDVLDELKRLLGIIADGQHGGEFRILGRDLESSPVTGVNIEHDDETGTKRIIPVRGGQSGG